MGCIVGCEVTEKRKGAKRKRKPAKRKDAKGKHGGERDNAGAKNKLDEKGLLIVGSWCEAENRRLRLKDRAQHEANHPDLEVYHDLVREAEWIREAETPEDRQRRFREHAASIADELPNIRGSRAFRQPHRREKDTGLRPKIIEAAWVRFRGDYPQLTLIAVDAAWNWYRRPERGFLRKHSGYNPNPDNANFSDES